MRLTLGACAPSTAYADLRPGEELTDDLRVKACTKALEMGAEYVEFHREVADHPRWLETWRKNGSFWRKVK